MGVSEGLANGWLYKDVWQHYLGRFATMHFAEDALYPIASVEVASQTVATELKCLLGADLPVEAHEIAVHAQAYLNGSPGTSLEVATVWTMDDVAMHALATSVKA
jgi:hypothetical protein